MKKPVIFLRYLNKENLDDLTSRDEIRFISKLKYPNAQLFILDDGELDCVISDEVLTDEYLCTTYTEFIDLWHQFKLGLLL